MRWLILSPRHKLQGEMMAFEIGEVLKAMDEDVMGRKLEEKIHEVRKEKNWDEFWIVYSMKPDMYLVNVLRESWIATDKRPNPISNTIHFYINWKQGRVESKAFVPSKSNLYDFPLLPGESEFNLNKKIGLADNSVFTEKDGLIVGA